MDYFKALNIAIVASLLIWGAYKFLNQSFEKTFPVTWQDRQFNLTAFDMTETRFSDNTKQVFYKFKFEGTQLQADDNYLFLECIYARTLGQERPIFIPSPEQLDRHSYKSGVKLSNYTEEDPAILVYVARTSVQAKRKSLLDTLEYLELFTKDDCPVFKAESEGLSPI